MMRGLVPLCAGAVVSSAGAAVVSVTGQATLIAPPPSTDSGVLVSDTTAYVFNERAGVTWGGPCDVYSMPFGVPFGITGPDRFAPPALVDSHMIHFDITGIDSDTQLVGTVTFDSPIYAVIFDATKLDPTDATLGAPGTTYPFGVGNRGFSNSTDLVWLVDAYTIRFQVHNFNTADQIRVLTESSVPAPASACVLAIGGVACVRRRR